MLFVATSIAGLIATPAAKGQSLADTVSKYTPESEFIFVAAVDTPGTSLMPLPGITDVAVVSIVRSMYSPDSYEIVPQQVTVQGDSVSQGISGSRHVFFSVGWIYGETLVVHVLHSDQLVPGFDLDELQAWVDEAAEKKRQEALQARIARSSQIVVGQVLTTQKDANARRLISERDPDWWKAEVHVQRVMKGRLPDSSIVARDTGLTRAYISFPTNPRWTALPQLDSASAGVFILRDSLHRLIIPPYPALVESFDLRPLSEVALIDSLISP